MPSYPTTFPVTGPATWSARVNRPQLDGGEARVFAGLTLSSLKGVWAPFYAVPGYKGALLKARRASDSAEIDVYNWSSLYSFLLGTTGFCTTLYDQSGNGNHAVQATADNQPGITLLSGGLIEDEYDGSNDRLRRNAQVVAGNAAFDLICVAKIVAGAGFALSVTQADAQPTRVGVAWGSGMANRVDLFTTNDANTTVSITGDNVSASGIYVARFGFTSATQAFLQLYGRAAKTATISGTFTLSRLDLGILTRSTGSFPYTGPIRFAAAAQPRLSDADWSLVAGRLASRLGAMVAT